MGCCCCFGHSSEEQGGEECGSNPGPDVKRRCTDAPCVFVLVAFMALPLCILIYLRDSGSVRNIDHGKDHYQNFCGMGELKNKRYVYFPDLQRDMSEDPTFRRHYGVCVEACPEQGSSVPDYPGEVGAVGIPERRPGQDWFVPLPSFGLAGRCIPYDPPWTFLDGVELCASPACTRTSRPPTQAQEVCGLQSDGTGSYWLLSRPDDILLDGWRREGATEELIRARQAVAGRISEEARESCQVKVFRDTRVRMESVNEKVSYKILTYYTGGVFTWCSTVYGKQAVVLGLGIGGSLLVSFLLIATFSCCVRYVLGCLVVLFFTVLVAADYLLFFRAGIVTGKTGRKVLGGFENATSIDVPEYIESFVHHAQESDDAAKIYEYLALGLAAVIVLLACVALASRRNFEILVALLREASRTVREMPSLLLAPLLLASSMVVVCLLLLRAMLAIAMVSPSEVQELTAVWSGVVQPQLERIGLGSDDPFGQVRQTALCITVFAFLWAYYFHQALSITVVAMTVSHWYFYRDDPEKNAGTGIHSQGWFFGRPILLALLRILRYHLGSLAFGSCIVAIATAIRVVLEYAIQKTQADQNSVTRCVAWAARCVSWCLEKCVKFVTEYAYVYVAVTGKPFCPSASASFVFFSKYPMQTALDTMASSTLCALLCVTVPTALAVASFAFVPDDWAPCAIFVFVLAYVITRLAAGVYDICLTTLFVCAMRDCENYGGIYMTPELRSACGFAELTRSSQARSVRLTRGVRGSEAGDLELETRESSRE